MHVRLFAPSNPDLGAETGPVKFPGQPPGIYLTGHTARGLAAAIRIVFSPQAVEEDDARRAARLLLLLARLIERDLIAANN